MITTILNLANCMILYSSKNNSILYTISPLTDRIYKEPVTNFKKSLPVSNRGNIFDEKFLPLYGKT